MFADGGYVDYSQDDTNERRNDEMDAAAAQKRAAAPSGGSSDSGITAAQAIRLGLAVAPYFAQRGGKVPGQAKVKGNSPKNDTVDAKLSPGEIVVPRTAADDPAKAERFVDAIIGKKKGRNAGKGYAGVAQAKRELQELKSRMATLEKKIGGAA